MPLLKEPPNTTIAIYGLVKTNDVAQGHHILVETFAPFGDIVDASVAPQYRGFGRLPVLRLLALIISEANLFVARQDS